MNKILALSIVMVMFFAAIPAVLGDQLTEPTGDCAWDDDNEASKITTEATVVGCGGPCYPGGGETGGGSNFDDGAPIIKCKWEYDLQVKVPEPDPCDPCEVCPELRHDACPCIPGLQVKPRLGKTVKIGYFAIVTDPNGKKHVDRVFADIWHPDKSFKYQIELFPLGVEGDNYNKQLAIDAWNHVKTYHSSLIYYNEPWAMSLEPPFDTPESDIDNELKEELAYVYYGERKIDYCQPAGYYYVGVIAHDKLQMWSPYLYNHFWYIPTAAVELDFTEVDYGNVVMSTPNECDGDDDMETEWMPTVKNVGNVPVFLEIWQDAMGFGKTDNKWNVEFQARMNEDGKYTPWYKPEQTVRIPGYLKMCTEDKLDFLIHVLKGYPLPCEEPNTGIMKLFANIDFSKPWKSPLSFDPAPLWIEDPLASYP